VRSTTHDVHLTPSGGPTSSKPPRSRRRSAFFPHPSPPPVPPADSIIPAAGGGRYQSAARFGKESIFFPRLDYDLNPKNHFFVNFNFANFDSTTAMRRNPTYSNSSSAPMAPRVSRTFPDRKLTAATLITRSMRFVFSGARNRKRAGANAPGPSVTINGVGNVRHANALPRLAEPDEHRYQITDIFSRKRDGIR